MSQDGRQQDPELVAARKAEAQSGADLQRAPLREAGHDRATRVRPQDLRQGAHPLQELRAGVPRRAPPWYVQYVASDRSQTLDSGLFGCLYRP